MKDHSTLNNERIPNEGQLFKRAQEEGDQEAYQTLFLPHYAELHSCIMRVVHKKEIAEELVQETYVKSWRYLPDLKELSRLKFWLLTIARRLALDWLEVEYRKKALSLEEIEGTSDLTDHTNNPEDVINTDKVLCTLALMKPVLRGILLLRIQGYLPAEIAQQLGKTEGTIKNYLSQARTEFRRLYDGLDRDENQKGE